MPPLHTNLLWLPTEIDEPAVLERREIAHPLGSWLQEDAERTDPGAHGKDPDEGRVIILIGSPVFAGLALLHHDGKESVLILEPLQPLPELWEQSVGLFDHEDFHGMCPALVKVTQVASMPTGTLNGRWPLRYLLLVDLMSDSVSVANLSQSQSTASARF